MSVEFSDEVTMPNAYGKLDVVCQRCGKANELWIDVGPDGRDFYPVKCVDCGERQNVTVEVSSA